VQPEDYDKFMAGAPKYTLEELEKRVPREYHSVIKVFMKKEADQLPLHHPKDYDIQLVNSANPLFSRNYQPTNIQECEVILKYIKEQLGKGFIQTSSSLIAAPVLVVRKPSSGLYVCIDYHALNEITIKNHYLILLITNTLAKLSQAKIFTKLDVVAAFNQIRIKEGKEWLIVFNTRYG
jgi:hypothetical protein